jgi:hypothetical protein
MKALFLHFQLFKAFSGDQQRRSQFGFTSGGTPAGLIGHAPDRAVASGSLSRSLEELAEAAARL